MKIGDVVCLKKWTRLLGNMRMDYSVGRKPHTAVMVYLGDVDDKADDFDCDAAMLRLGWVRARRHVADHDAPAVDDSADCELA